MDIWGFMKGKDLGRRGEPHKGRLREKQKHTLQWGDNRLLEGAGRGGRRCRRAAPRLVLRGKEGEHYYQLRLLDAHNASDTAPYHQSSMQENEETRRSVVPSHLPRQGGEHERRDALKLAQVEVGAAIEQCAHNRLVAERRGDHQQSASLLVGGVNKPTGLQPRAYCPRVAALNRAPRVEQGGLAASRRSWRRTTARRAELCGAERHDYVGAAAIQAKVVVAVCSTRSDCCPEPDGDSTAYLLALCNTSSVSREGSVKQS
eukprot:6186313-Pleurochrysis_carterae.AAC.2